MKGKKSVENPCPCCDTIENLVERTKWENGYKDMLEEISTKHSDKDYEIGTLEDQEKFEKSRGGLLGKNSKS